VEGSDYACLPSTPVGRNLQILKAHKRALPTLIQPILPPNCSDMFWRYPTIRPSSPAPAPEGEMFAREQSGVPAPIHRVRHKLSVPPFITELIFRFISYAPPAVPNGKEVLCPTITLRERITDFSQTPRSAPAKKYKELCNP